MFRVLVLLAILAGTAAGQGKAPTLRVQRQDEDWSQLTGEPLKNIALGEWRFSLGGDIRERFEWFSNEDTAGSPAESYLLQRYMIHADMRYGERVRFFVQVKSGVENGRRDGPRPTDKDSLDFHQGWAEFGIGKGLSLRIGRQEVGLGSSRLVSIREAPNVRLSFDGARLRWESTEWRADLLALRPSQTNPGYFDNSPDFRQALWGVYTTWKSRNLDLYYLGLDRKRRHFDAGSGREQRHSFGGRWWRPAGRGRDYDFEGVWQGGRFGSGSIHAWTAASNTGYTWESIGFKPRAGLKADITSGDRNPRDGSLGTFNALFPKGNYFSQADLLGPNNLMDLHPSLRVELARGFGVTVDADFFWRCSVRDGIYDIPGFLIVSGAGSRARPIGRAVKAGFDWQANRHLSFEAEFQHFWAGAFLRESGRGRPIRFLAAWATYRF